MLGGHLLSYIARIGRKMAQKSLSNNTVRINLKRRVKAKHLSTSNGRKNGTDRPPTPTKRSSQKNGSRVGANKKRFACKLCTKSFAQKINLKTHELVHSGVKPFKCFVCEKRFRQVTTLNVHMRRHTEEKPFKCQQCDRAFPQKANLNVHVETHH